MRTYPSALSSGGVSSVGEICPRDCMRPHVEPTVNERELVSVRVPVVRQYGEVAFALVQATSVAVYYAVVVQGDLPLIQLSQAYLAYLLRFGSMVHPLRLTLLPCSTTAAGGCAPHPKQAKSSAASTA